MNPTESASRLRVALVVSADTVDIVSSGSSLGQWKCDDVNASRYEGNWFRLEIEDEDWRFLPDAPTEFLFYGVPLMAGTPLRRWHLRVGYDTPDLLSVGRTALGAALAALLISIGMLIGRYQLDDSRVSVLAVLLAGAGLGAWWTAVSMREPTQLQESTKSKRPLVMPSHKGHSALSVHEVIAESQVDTTESGVDRQTNGPPPEIGASESTDSTDDRRRAPEDPETSAPVDTVAHVDINIETPAPEEPQLHESAPVGLGVGNDDARHAEAASEPTRGQETPTEVHNDIAASHDPFSAPEPITSQAGDSLEAETDDQVSQGEPEPRLGPSVSVAELLELTANVAGRIDLTERAVDRDDAVSPIDLTAVRGIGPALSAGLTRLGVSDVHDLAVLDAEDQAYLGERLGRYATSDRLRQWVEGAQRIIAEQHTRDDL